jgi:hypothetical protein
MIGYGPRRACAIIFDGSSARTALDARVDAGVG